MEQNGPTTLGTTSDAWQDEKLLECGIPESSLRFTTTSYGRIDLPPFVHPNEHRVIMSVPAADLCLTDLERQILTEIVGAKRLDHHNLRLSANQFGSRIENKRHLVSMLNRLVLSAKSLAQEVEEEYQAQVMAAAAAES